MSQGWRPQFVIARSESDEAIHLKYLLDGCARRPGLAMTGQNKAPPGALSR